MSLGCKIRATREEIRTVWWNIELRPKKILFLFVLAVAVFDGTVLPRPLGFAGFHQHSLKLESTGRGRITTVELSSKQRHLPSPQAEDAYWMLWSLANYNQCL